jgi:hypothetical protein
MKAGFLPKMEKVDMYRLEREKAGIAWKIILFIEMSSYRM